MKKQNNRFRNGNNNNNNGYTLNYKFDSVSIAGKISGTALDLIRRYNDLAKEAQSGGNYVEMEVYRQYAEHYRKIVTDINERRQSRQDSQMQQSKAEDNTAETAQTAPEERSDPAEVTPAANGYVETLPAAETAKSFTVVEINEPEEKPAQELEVKKPVRRRTLTTRKSAAAKTASKTAEPQAAEA